MSLKTKVITLLLCVFGAYAITASAVRHFVLLPAFVALEKTAATDNVERALQALQREIEILIPSAADWATWDDTYQFMIDRNPGYIEANLNMQALDSLKVNLMGFYDPEGRRIWGIAYDYTGKEMTLGSLAADRLSPGHPLMVGPDMLETVSGLYRSPAGIFTVATRPILTSQGEGPSHGRFLIGRLLDKAAVDRLGAQARVKLSVAPLKPRNAPGKVPEKSAATHNSMIDHTPITLENDEAITRSYTDVLDVGGTPILRFRVDTPRDIVAQGKATLQYASLSQTIAGGVVLLVLLIFMRRTVFDPISRLTRHATDLGISDDLSARLDMDRGDEIGILAREFDQMVERLSETRKRLLDQSYKSGIAEMASGALHNIGNAVTPIGVKLIHLKHELEQAPAAEMAMAGSELAGPAAPPDRRADLAQFVALAGEELAAVIKHTAAELDAIRGQIDHVQMILADQQRFSRAERIIEPLALHRIVEETAALLPDDIRTGIRIDVDEGLAGIGRVSAARIALQQIVSNLFINAAESIGEIVRARKNDGKEPLPGSIRVHAAADTYHHGFAHLCFEDNGAGISPEHLSHLFERGFSTKSRGSGMGLHWCANTVAAMGGRIYAESAGPGRGACLHLLLPFAENPTHNLKDVA